MQQARRSDSPITVCRCATASRLALTEARAVPVHPASDRPAASSDWRSRLQPAEPLLAGKIGCLRPGLMLPQNADNLLFRKPRLLHLSVLQKAEL